MPPKQCYYEVLGVEETAGSDDLKKAYKKCALRWHPDKNIGNEDAHNQFLLIKEAFSVLSDPQERAWYDRHKDQILSEGTEEVHCFNVYPYFTTSCFSGFGDDERGYYTVYRQVFQTIADEDSAISGQKMTVPSFGNSQSPFLEEVELFYNYWSHYCTQVTYAWVDEKVLREYGRKAVKFLQKENQKKRDKLKKERNEEVRNLVSFVRKRDKRVALWRAKMEEEKREKEKRHEEIRREQFIERKRMIEKQEEGDWSKFSCVEDELEKLEESLNERFGNSEDSDTDSEESEAEAPKVSSLYCVACRKLFQSEKAFQNHEASKKHKQNIAKLAEE